MTPAPAPARAPLKPLDVALAELLAQAVQLNGLESISTFDADGRVLAEDLRSALHVPPQDNSSMDGYAMRCADVPTAGAVLSVSQRIPAGSAALPLQTGTAARIFTGAAIPAGADTVVMQEECETLPEQNGMAQIRVNALPAVGQWIRRAGEDVALGAVVLQKGERLSPASIGLAASIGMATLPVVRRPKVALFSTGDELVMPGDIAPENMPTGSIYNSNRFFLRAMLLRLGCEVTDFGIVPDNLDATKTALSNAAQAHDLILTSGGVSVGEEDHIKPAVQALGELNLWQIAIKPGKPFAYGKVGQTHFIGLPGNPVSSFVTFMLLVRPFILKLQGVQNVDAFATKTIAMRADFTVAKADKRREFLRVKRNANGGLDLFANQSSGVLTSAVWGDGLVNNPAGQTIAPGDMVQYTAFAEVLT
ncbi:MAG: molybdopterin molybdotransferase MoeA [Polaromonas sp.]|nr:molybdopterin molybdotransferase MoeA [Polaromonas sp.]MBP6156056.1 molybdopterin molybdotransferase MoeA [Polaromonas sp.]